MLIEPERGGSGVVQMQVEDDEERSELRRLLSREESDDLAQTVAHTGADGGEVARPTGTPVHAPGPGVVTLAEPDLFYSGGTIILDHGYGLSSSFLHMSQIDVRVGDVLETGDVMGAIGATGRATGPHLDWRMSWFNQRVDPQLLVPPMP